jgi:MFS transporter, DHA2 family, multidrug resistance protein
MKQTPASNLPHDLPHNYRWIVMGIIMIGTMMATLDMSIVNISIPNIMADFGINVEDVEWVVTGYMLAFATLMPLTAWIRDHIGYKSLYIWSLFLFTLGSLLCGAAWNIESLVAARVLQALGGGAITPTGMAMISEVFPPGEKGKALGIWGMGFIVGSAIGPTLGGYLTNTFGWRSIFLINLPIGIITILLSIQLLKADKPHESNHRPFDIWGFISLSLFLIFLLLSLSKGGKEGWTSAFIISCTSISLISFIIFLLVESSEEHGIIDLKLFKYPEFSISAIVVVVRSIALFGSTFLIPLFLQQQMGFNAIQSGLIMMPGALILLFLMPFAGRLGDVIGAKIPTVFGMIMLAIFMFMYRNLDINMSIMDIINPMLVRGVGMALLMAPILAVALNAVPQNKSGMASSMLNIIMQVGGSIGIALLTTVFTNRIHFHLGVVGASAKINIPSFSYTFENLSNHVHSLGYTYAQSKQIADALIFKKLSQSAVIMSFQDAFIVVGFFTLIALIPALFLPGRKAMSHKKKEELEEVTIL